MKGKKYFFRNPDKWVSKTAPFVQISEGIKIFLRGGCAKVVLKFLISEGVQIRGVFQISERRWFSKPKTVGGLKYINKYITYSPKKNEFLIYRKE